jgi:hypothetical protein
LENLSFLPKKFRILSGSALKLLAVIFMIIDHIAVAFLSKNPILLFTVGSKAFTLYHIMRYIGRLAFPLFAFLLVEGFLHTKNRKAYGQNLLIFALISEIPWNLFRSGTWHFSGQNIFFTLFLGFLGLLVLEKFKDKPTKQVLLLLLGFILSIVLRVDYLAGGYVFILLLYILRDKRAAQAVIGCSILSNGLIAGLSFLPINMYNGERGFIKGKFMKYAFYAIYPIHILILFIIKKI